MACVMERYLGQYNPTIPNTDGVRASHNNHSQFLTVLPSDIHLLILKNLNRNDIDNCALVCRQLEALISYNMQHLPHHIIRELRLEELRAGIFTLSMRCDEFKRTWKFSREVSARKRKQSKMWMESKRSNKSPSMNLFTSHYGQKAKKFSMYIIGERSEDNWEYKMQLHSPPVALYTKLAELFEKAEIHQFSLIDLRLTDTFADCFNEIFVNQPIKCHTLQLERIKLLYISANRFDRMIRLIDMQSIEMCWIRHHSSHLLTDYFISKALSCRSLDLRCIHPCLSMWDDNFLLSFYTNPYKKKNLLIDRSSITNAGIHRLIEHWTFNSDPVRINFVLRSDEFRANEFAHKYAKQSYSYDQIYAVNHSLLSVKLFIHICEDIVELTTTDYSKREILPLRKIRFV